jgi:hypothetical protein
VLVVAEPFANALPTPASWLNKDFFKIEHPKCVVVTFPDETNSWKLARDTEASAWKLVDAKPGEVLDTNKIYGYTSPFASPSFDDVLSKNATPEANGLEKPSVITVETFDDITYTVKVGTKTNENYPLKLSVTANFPKERVVPPDEKPEDKEKAEKAWKDKQKQLEDKFKQAQGFTDRTYLVTGWSVEALLKPRKDLLEEKKEEPKTEATTTPADVGEKKEDLKPVTAPATGTNTVKRRPDGD